MHSPRYPLALPAILLTLTLPACSSEEPDTPLQVAPAPEPLPPLTDTPLLTTERTLTVLHAIDDLASQNPSVPAQIDQMLSEGYGELGEGPGQAVSTATLDGAEPPQPGPNPKLLSRFLHLADTQLADDESPDRSAVFDSPGVLAGAFRPQEGYECRILNAAVRTINAVHAKTPFDFVLLGGDNADNAQANELGWFMAILDGSESVECDSGKDDDPVAGPGNDPKDPFFAEGLAMPWRWVTGNHDILHQGTFLIRAGVATGSTADGGTRDWSLPGAPVVKGEVPPDPRRAQLTRSTLLAQVGADQDGHGIGAAEMAYGKAYTWFDVEDGPLRIVILDTAAETGDSEGVIHQADVVRFIKPALDRAKSDHKWVILVSHHASARLSDGSSVGSETQADALTPDAWRSFVGGYDNVLLHLAGHTHVHRVTKTEPAGGHAYWEVETSALADYPHQMRAIEIWDEDDGFVTIRGTAFDYVVDGDPIAEDGRRRSIVDLTSGFSGDGSGEASARNIVLWIKKPE